MKTLYALCVTLGILFGSKLRAETIITTRLHALHGQVVAQTPEWVEVRTEFGTMRVPRANIVRIEKDTPAMAAERSETAWQSKDFAEKMMAEGKVLYHGRWVTPDEKAAQEAKVAEATRRAAEELAEKQRRAEEEAKRDAEARADVQSQIQEEEQRYYIKHQALPSVRQKLLKSSDYR